jgi:hypothetical protein
MGQGEETLIRQSLNSRQMYGHVTGFIYIVIKNNASSPKEIHILA